VIYHFSKAEFGSSGFQATGNTDEQSLKIVNMQREGTQWVIQGPTHSKWANYPGPGVTSEI
jgi:hypothetical protein